MEYTLLGQSSLSVSRLGIGCEPLGGTDCGAVDKKDLHAAIQTALENGVNLFDTADVYGLGESERALADALGAKRHSAVIVTKFGVNWQIQSGSARARTFFDCSPDRLDLALGNSLQRLRIESIPLYMVHWPDPFTPIEKTMVALSRHVQAGKIRHVGLSNFTAEGIRAAHAICPITAVELPYNLIDRRMEDETMPCCEALNIGVLAYGPLAQGLLSGKYSHGCSFGVNDRRHRLPHFSNAAVASSEGLLETLRALGEANGRPISQVAIRWVLRNPAISAAITGVKNPRQVLDNIGTFDWELGDHDHALLTRPDGHSRVRSPTLELSSQTDELGR